MPAGALQRLRYGCPEKSSDPRRQILGCTVPPERSGDGYNKLIVARAHLRRSDPSKGDAKFIVVDFLKGSTPVMPRLSDIAG